MALAYLHLVDCPPALRISPIVTEGEPVPCIVQAVAGSCGDIHIISVVEAQVVFLLKGLYMGPCLYLHRSGVVQGTCCALLSDAFSLMVTTEVFAYSAYVCFWVAQATLQQS